MSESMIERVARAIDPEIWKVVEDYCDAKDYSPHDRAIVFEHSPRIQASLSRARAAIEAMRNPPRDVLTAFVGADVDTFVAGVRWEAAIDAALTPSPAAK
jgi:hypothetical protein